MEDELIFLSKTHFFLSWPWPDSYPCSDTVHFLPVSRSHLSGGTSRGPPASDLIGWTLHLLVGPWIYINSNFTTTTFEQTVAVSKRFILYCGRPKNDYIKKLRMLVVWVHNICLTGATFCIIGIIQLTADGFISYLKVSDTK